ncbi:MAG: 3-phosphoshikimate 1-carboxyvinyltransferase [Saccharolobus sp.]
MIVKIYPSKVSGEIKAPQSKSIAIRLIFLSLFTKIKLKNLTLSEDVIDAITSVKALGVKVKDNYEFIPPEKLEIRENYIKLKGSATTLRILIPIVAAIGGKVTIDAEGSLKKRPIKRIVEALSISGVNFSSDTLPVKISGKLNTDFIRISGDESSQYISGLIYALHILSGGSLEIISPISSKSYIYLTINLLNRLGSKIVMDGNKILVKPGKLSEYEGEVPGDYGLSSFYALAALTTEGELLINNLWKPESYFGDHTIVKIFKDMGAESEYYNGSWKVKGSNSYKPITINIDDAPDLAMPIVGLCSIAEGECKICGIRRLRTKESNRVESIGKILMSYGVKVEANEDKLVIYGKSRGLLNKFVSTDCFNDHRVAMMSSALALITGGVINDAECVNKSNPNYWKDLISLGAKISIQ